MKTLYYNGHVHSMEMEDAVFSSLGVNGKRIDYVGNERPSGYGKYVDLKGMHVFPAMTDSHLHLLYSIVLSAGSFQVCEIRDGSVTPDSIEAVGTRIKKYCAHADSKKIICGNGYIPSAISEKRLPTRHELDLWGGGRPIIIYSIDGHSSAMSGTLMDMLGIDKQGHSGIFSGEEHEFIQGRVTELIAASVSPALLAKGIANFSNTCAEYGIARVCAMDGNEDVKNDILTSLLALIARRMPVGVRLFPQYIELKRAEKLKAKLLHPRAGGCGAWELDGSVGSRSAAFYSPYLDGSQGHRYYSDEKINAKVCEALEKGLQLSAHAIGESAIDQISEAYSHASSLIPKAGPMPRIDHFEFPSQKAKEAAKSLRLAITVQPGFSWVDKRYLKSYERFLPKEIISRQLPLLELCKAGVCLCGSSDSPVQSVSPFEQMLGMVDFYIAEQSLTNYQALCTYTKNPAAMLGEEADFGTLSPGKLADFFLCKTDLCSCSPDELASAKAEKTFISGKPWRKMRGTLPELIGLLLSLPHKI